MNLGIAFIKIGDKDEARAALYNAKKLGNVDADRFIREWC
jgi:Flp pilus assembly protein TadD